MHILVAGVNIEVLSIEIFVCLWRLVWAHRDSGRVLLLP